MESGIRQLRYLLMLAQSYMLRIAWKVFSTTLYFDVTDENAAKKAIMQIKKEQGHLDVLVNNAGIMKDNVIGMISKDLMQKVFDVNVLQ